MLNTECIKKKTHQLDLIKNSVPKEVDLDNIEVITNKDYPPWKRKIPYKVNIGHLPKEDQVLIHQAKVQHAMGTSTILYYTDASYYPEATGIGTAFVAYDQMTSRTWKQYKNIGQENIIYNGELEAITSALEHARCFTGQRDKIIIFSDIKVALHGLKSLDNTPGQMWLLRSLS
ncbi:hypothetical protein K3495_g12845 [Podosphaera aphanis]|nr:hypothetical protein K3495_g12845 [Podosphaera aphanis]